MQTKSCDLGSTDAVLILRPFISVSVNPPVVEGVNSATELHRAAAPTPRVDPPVRPTSAYLRCAADNAKRVPTGYFSIEQLVAALIVRTMEGFGYVLPTGLSPDTSVGLIFSRHLRDSGIHIDDIAKYDYVGPNGNKARVRAYPHRLLPQVRRWITEVWLVEYAPKYFRRADPKALTPVIRMIEQRKVMRMAA